MERTGKKETKLEITQPQSPTKSQIDLLLQHNHLNALASSPRTQAPVRDYDLLSRSLNKERETVALLKQEQEQSKNELETLHQQLEVQKVALTSSSTEASALRAQLRDANLQIANLENAANTTNGLLLAARKELAAAQAETAELRDSLSTVQSQYEDLQREHTQLLHTSSEHEEKLQTLENLVEYKDRENELLRNQLEHEKTVNRLNDELVQKYKAEAENAGSMAVTTAATGDPQFEQLQTKLVELNQHREQLQDMVEMLKEQLEHSQREQQRLVSIAEQADQRVLDLEKMLEAERSTYEAKELAREMGSARDLLAKQSYENLLQEFNALRGEKDLAVRQRSAMETKLTQTREDLSHCQQQLHEYRTKLNEQQLALQEQHKSQALAVEVTALRKKLQELQAHIAREELQEERQSAIAHNANPMAWAANVQKSRDLYDSVVRELQNELEKEIRLRKELQAQLNELQAQLSDAEAACAKLDVYKSEAQNAARREQQLLLEKTTLEQQAVEFTHDRRRLERELDRMHDEVVTLREQLQLAGEASERARRRAEEATLMKLQVEKERAQLQSEHYKSQAMLDELRRRHSVSEHASVSMQQDLRDLHTQATSLREECEQLRHNNAELRCQNHEHTQALVQSRDLIAKYEGEIRLLETSKSSLLESLSVEREETAIKQRRINSLEEEKAQLSRQLEDMADQHSAQLMDASVLATVSIEQQLRELKLEFEQTTTRWAKVEQEKRDKESDIKKLQNALEKEKQVNMLHKAQVALLEDQIRAMRDELEVYRKLDVYSRAYSQELANTRRQVQERQAQTKFTEPTPSSANGKTAAIPQSVHSSAKLLHNRIAEMSDSDESEAEIGRMASSAATPHVDATSRQHSSSTLASASSLAARRTTFDSATTHSTPDRRPARVWDLSTAQSSRLQVPNTDILNRSREDFQRARQLLSRWSEK